MATAAASTPRTSSIWTPTAPTLATDILVRRIRTTAGFRNHWDRVVSVLEFTGPRFWAVQPPGVLAQEGTLVARTLRDGHHVFRPGSLQPAVTCSTSNPVAARVRRNDPRMPPFGKMTCDPLRRLMVPLRERHVSRPCNRTMGVNRDRSPHSYRQAKTKSSNDLEALQDGPMRRDPVGLFGARAETPTPGTCP